MADFVPLRKRRHAITDKQRRQIRDYKRANSKATQQAIAQWATLTFGRTISQSTVHDCLNEKYHFVDRQRFHASNEGKHRIRHGEHPLLERALFEWHQRLQAKRIPVNGELVQAAGASLWQRIPELKNQPPPKFSKGWLHGFKHRFGIRSFRQHGEVASAQQASAEDRMVELRAICAGYPPQDQYNADETGLFWKMIPDITLATERQSGAKKEKDRITAMVCANADGSHKLDLWLIGEAKNQRAFGAKQCRILAYPVRWLNNEKAWMTGEYFEKYLRWFDGQMAGRRVLLLIDGFGAHEAAIRSLEADPLRNTRVEFLPANCTSIYQPMDQGIIHSLKARYRRSWLTFMVDFTVQEQDPVKEIDVLWAVRWITYAWNKVTADTIRNCWLKTTLLGFVAGPHRASPGFDPLIEEVKQKALQLRIQGNMNLADLIEHPQEREQEDPVTAEDILDYVAEAFTSEQQEEQENPVTAEDILDYVAEAFTSEQSEEQEEQQQHQMQEEQQQNQEQIKASEALQALATVRAWEEQQADGSMDFLSLLAKRERVLMHQRRAENAKQTTLDGFLGRQA